MSIRELMDANPDLEFVQQNNPVARENRIKIRGKDGNPEPATIVKTFGAGYDDEDRLAELLEKGIAYQRTQMKK